MFSLVFLAIELALSAAIFLIKIAFKAIFWIVKTVYTLTYHAIHGIYWELRREKDKERYIALAGTTGVRPHFS